MKIIITIIIGYMNNSRVIVLKWKEYSIRNLKYSIFKLK
jgi:hypothetical protein